MRCLFDMMDMLWLLPLGFIAGTIGSMVGLGGGIITVPVMTLAGYSPTLAVTVSLYAIFSNAAASTILYARRGLVEYKTGIFMAAIAIPGTALGAIASSWVKQDEFQVLFGILMITVAIYTATIRGQRQLSALQQQVGTVSRTRRADLIVSSAICTSRNFPSSAIVPRGKSTDSSFTSSGTAASPTIPTIAAAIVIGINACALVAMRF